MVRKILLRGHVIRLFGVQPSTSQSEPPSCPTCGTTYDDGQNRKCIYLCCEFEDCFDCVINQNKYQCYKFKPQPRKYLVSEDDQKEDEETLNLTSNPESVQTTTLSEIRSDDKTENEIISSTDIKREYESVQFDLKFNLEKYLPEKHRNAMVSLERISRPAAVSNENQSELKDDRPVLVAKRRSSRLIRGTNSKA